MIFEANIAANVKTLENKFNCVILKLKAEYSPQPK